MTKELSYWLAFDCLKVGIGVQKIEKLYKHFGSLEEAWEASPSELLNLKLSERTVDKFFRKKEEINPSEKLETIEKNNIQVHRFIDTSYPDDLNLLSNKPALIYTKGLWDKNCFKKSIGIVGTREPTEYAFFMTQQISQELSSKEFVVISGMALGIDTAAHLGATSHDYLYNNRITSVAVVPGGVDQIVPFRNKRIYQILEEKGCLLSEHFPGTKPEIGFFPLRNRIIAALSQAVLIAEAPKKSGSLITAREALKINKPVFGLSGRADNQKNSGLYEFFRENYQTSKIVASSDDIIEELSKNQNKENFEIKKNRKVENLNQEEEKIYQILANSPEKSEKIDQIIEKSKLEISKINMLILKLKLKKLIREDSSGKIFLEV